MPCGVHKTQEAQSEAKMGTMEDNPASGQLADHLTQAHHRPICLALGQGENEDMETDNDAIDVTKIMSKQDMFCLEYAKDVYEYLKTLEVSLKAGGTQT